MPMSVSTAGKATALIGGIIVIGAGVAAMSGFFNKPFTDEGIDVSKTACEDIATARIAVDNEFETRKQNAEDKRDLAMEKASNDFWSENRRLEDAYHECISAAVSADPCKDAFEEVGRLYEEIMADFEAGKGFNEAKFNEREQAKNEYEECVQKARDDEFYKADVALCDETLKIGREQNQNNRNIAEIEAIKLYDSSVAVAKNAREEKHTILNAIEKKCNEPGGNTNVAIGGLTTEGAGTQIQSSSPACTGVFEGNDPDLKKKLQDLENQLQKARAAGLSDGLYGTTHLQSAIDDARQQLRESERSCETDADCGDVRPVCCSGKEVGRVYCDGGTCANEIVVCEDNEICAGSPAQCVAPDTGVQQEEGVYISRTIPERGPCSQNLQVLNMQQKSTDSVRYEITGNIPSWVKIDKPGGPLPASVTVTYLCNTVQGFGPGTYTANGSVTIYNANNELINTIPFVVSITVESESDIIEVIEYNGKYIPLNQIYRFAGPECDKEEHWHANSGTVTATDGTVITDADECGYGKTKNVPVINIAGSEAKVEVRGLEGLR